MRYLKLIITAILFCAVGHAQGRKGGPGLLESDTGHRWVESTLNEMSLEEKVGQMLQVEYYADYKGPNSKEYHQLREEMGKYHLGSLILGMHFNQSRAVRVSPIDVARISNQLQADSNVPLLLAADLERGVASRLKDVPSFHGQWHGARRVKLVQ